MADRCCKTCMHLRVPPDQAGRRVVRAGSAYTCTVEVPAPPLPDSITRCYGFRPFDRSYMRGGDGTECPTWQPLNKPTSKKP